MSNSEQRRRILLALAAEESPIRDRGVAMMVSFMLDRRVGELIDVAATVELTTTALGEGSAERIAREHLSPAWDRHRARSAEAKERVEDALPLHVRDTLLKLAAKQRLPRAAWADGAVDPKLLRELFAPVLQSTLVSFARKLPLLATGGGEDEGGAGGDGDGGGAEADDDESSGRLGSIAGRLRRGAQKRAGQIASVGKNVVGNLGGEIDKRMAAAAKDLSAGAQKELREALGERLKSERGRELLGEIQKQALARVLSTEVAVLMEDVESLPRAELEALIGPVLSHNAGRAFGQRVVEEEVRAFVDREGDKKVRALAEELGVLDAATRSLTAAFDALARELFADHGFGEWLEELLAL